MSRMLANGNLRRPDLVGFSVSEAAGDRNVTVRMAIPVLLGAVLVTVTARAEPVKTDLHGIALGMTTEQAMAAAALPCSKLPYSSDIACKDATDESDYNASFSAGTPSVVLTVAHSFCSHEAPPAILGRLLSEFHVAQTSAEPDPNGFHVDLDPKTEAILNADDGTCPAGRGKHYVLSLRSNALITTESNRAVDRAKKALK